MKASVLPLKEEGGLLFTRCWRCGHLSNKTRKLVKMLRKTISIMEITWLAIVYLRNGTFHRLAFLKQYKQYCFWSVLTMKSGLWNVKMEAFLVWLPKKDHSNHPALLFLTLPTLNGCKFETWIQLKNDDFKKLHWKDLELAIKYRETTICFPSLGNGKQKPADTHWPGSGSQLAIQHGCIQTPHHGEGQQGTQLPRTRLPCFCCSEHNHHHAHSPTLLTSYILFKCSSYFKLHTLSCQIPLLNCYGGQQLKLERACTTAEVTEATHL